MNNPHQTTPTDIEIAASARRVITLIQEGQVDGALVLLQRTREAERPVVQEALDRYVAAGAMPQIWAHALAGRLDAADGPVLERLQQATAFPRMPEVSHRPDGPNELAGLSAAQTYDIYASMVETRGNDAARTDLQRTDYSVLLGLRRETSALASPGGNAGTGVYDDQIIVLMRTAGGEKRTFIADRASTEPTAQYSHHAGSDGRRAFAGERAVESRRIAPAPGYEDVRRRAIQGVDANNDTMRDLGRLADGTFEMQLAEHQNPPSAGTQDALRPSPDQLAPHRIVGLVQRDTNGDGYFNDEDPHGVQNLNETFKIHSGSRSNTDSAGCQTIHPDHYLAFIGAVTSSRQQTRWQYVLTSTRDELARELEVERYGPREGAQPGEAPPQRGNEPGHVPAIPRGDGPRLDSQELQRIEQRRNPQGHEAATAGPFNDPRLNHYYAAVMGGNAALADRIALGFASRLQEPGAQRPDGAHSGVDEVAQDEQAARVQAPGLQV